MDNDTNLESLFNDVFSDQQETSAGDDGQQKGEAPVEESKEQEAAQEPQKPQEQSKDERAAQAAARREREERERRREQRAYQTARQEMSSLIRELGISDPDKGTPIDSVDALEAYARALREERLNAGNPTGDDIKQIVREEISNSQRQQTQQTEKKASDDRLVQEQLAQIRAMDPAMTDLKSILESEAGPKFREYVGKGLDFVDAYKLAAEVRLAGIQTNRQGARTGGKGHLRSTQQQGAGDLDVPADEMAIFRELNPDMSEAEIRSFYNDYKKGMK